MLVRLQTEIAEDWSWITSGPKVCSYPNCIESYISCSVDCGDGTCDTATGTCLCPSDRMNSGCTDGASGSGGGGSNLEPGQY